MQRCPSVIYPLLRRWSHRNVAWTGYWILSTSGHERRSNLDRFIWSDSWRMSRSAWRWFDDVHRWTIAHCSFRYSHRQFSLDRLIAAFRLWRILFKNIFKVNVVTAINYHCVVLVVPMLRVNKCAAFSVHRNEIDEYFLFESKRKVFAWNTYDWSERMIYF